MITRRALALALVVPLGVGLIAGCKRASPPERGAAGPSCLARSVVPSPAAPAGSSVVPTLPASGVPASGPALPDLTLRCLTGGLARLTEITGPVIINLWASWCEPCQQELPAFREYHDHTPGAVPVLGVATRDSQAGAQTAVTDHQLDFPILWDQDGLLLRAVGVVLLPATVVVAPGGRIAYVYNSKPLDVGGITRLAHDYLGAGATPR